LVQKSKLCFELKNNVDHKAYIGVCKFKEKYKYFYRVFQASYGYVGHHEQDFQLYSLSLAKTFGT
jgi:hypothetical protein